MATTTAPTRGCTCLDPLFYDIPDVMRILGISKKSVEKLISSGELDSTLVLTRRKVYRDSVDAFRRDRDATS
jgi:hypothetical protein